jgi:hypothetical protein
LNPPDARYPRACALPGQPPPIIPTRIPSTIRLLSLGLRVVCAQAPRRNWPDNAQATASK